MLSRKPLIHLRSQRVMRIRKDSFQFPTIHYDELNVMRLHGWKAPITSSRNTTAKTLIQPIIGCAYSQL